MRMLVKDCKDKIRVGMIVRTNFGSCGGDFIRGEIGEIQDDRFYIWQNLNDGMKGEKSPSEKGYKFSWVVCFNEIDSTWIEILSSQLMESNSFQDVMHDLELERLSYAKMRLAKQEEQKMNTVIAKLFEKTADAVLVQKWYGSLIQHDIDFIIFNGKQKEILEMAQKKEEESKLSTSK